MCMAVATLTEKEHRMLSEEPGSTVLNPYRELIKNILDTGIDIFNTRTGTVCKTVVGAQLEFSLDQGFPCITSRKAPFKGAVGELLGFFRGYTSASDFRKLGCKFWDSNANMTDKWLHNRYRKGTDDCGDIYGKQWTNWESTRISTSHEEDIYLLTNGWEYKGQLKSANHDTPDSSVFTKSINQLENAVTTILTDPSDRRIIVSGWNVGEMDKMSLPPCHIQYTFIPIEETNRLSVVMTIRSMDVFLGTPSNIITTAVFLSIMARLTGYTADKVIIQGSNAHLYENQFEVAAELLTRKELPAPTLVLGSNIKQITDLHDVTGCFERINPEDIWLEGYESLGALTVPMIP